MGTPRLILITRPATDAALLAADIKKNGWQPLIAPLLTIHPLTESIPDLQTALDQATAVLVTSSNGVRALAQFDSRRDTVLLAVGPMTAATARQEGFTKIVTAAGDVTNLTSLVKSKLQPQDGPLLHISGTHQAGDLAAALGAAGFTIRRLVLYKAQAATTLPDEVIMALKQGHLAAVSLFSPRTAAIFVDLIHTAGLASLCRTVAALCLSKAVAQKASVLPWKKTLIATQNEAGALIEMLPRIESEG
ncbi:MAG: uroporphyrinogen-III synthase [Alphaproteobacteria bacterium]